MLYITGDRFFTLGSDQVTSLYFGLCQFHVALCAAMCRQVRSLGHLASCPHSLTKLLANKLSTSKVGFQVGLEQSDGYCRTMLVRPSQPAISQELRRVITPSNPGTFPYWVLTTALNEAFQALKSLPLDLGIIRPLICQKAPCGAGQALAAWERSLAWFAGAFPKS